MDVNLLNKICFGLIITIAIIELIVYCSILSVNEEQVDITNTTCEKSLHIGRKLSLLNEI